MSERSDPELLEAVRAGERSAIDELLERYEPRIYRFGLRMCGDEEAAKEVLQDTLLAAFRNLPGFRGDASLSTWLYQIARSFCIKARRNPVATVPIAEDLVDPARSADDAAHARQLGAALAGAIAALPDEQREAIVLRDVEGLSADEAAAIAGVEIGALKSRLHRARTAVRERLAAWVDGGGAAPCPALAQELAAYAGADVDQAACARIEQHLAGCPKCAAACSALQRTVSLCRAIPGGAVPTSVRDAVHAAIAEAISAGTGRAGPR